MMVLKKMKTWFSDQPKRKLFLAGGVCLWLLLCIFLTPVYTTVSLRFSEDPHGEAITTVFLSARENVTISGARPRVINNGEARISYLDFQYGSHSSLRRIDPVDEYWGASEPLILQELVVYKNGIPVLEISDSALADYFMGNEQLQLESQEDGLSMTVTGGDPQLLPNNQFYAVYASSGRVITVLSSFFFGGLIWICFFAVLFWFASQIRTCEDRFQKASYWIYFAGLFGAVFLCLYVGMRSPFWINPDEYDTKAAVLYYFTHWMPPDIRSDIINDSYPVYGTSRHFEWNIFYFLAGKLGLLFSDPALQIRALGLLLFLVMAILILKYSRKYFAFLCILLLTPQVWYIFSYSTSDALDFFVGFLCLFQLIRKESFLNRLLEKPFSKKQLPIYFLLAFLFVNVFWSKASFYPILVLLFLILLIRLFEKQGEERKRLLWKYLGIAGLTLTIFLVRYLITDYPYYGFDKLNVIIEVTERHAEYGYKPSTPPLLQAPSMSFMGKGITLTEFFRDYEFNKNLFRTFAGFFGFYAFGAANWYYVVMGILYLAFFGLLTYYIWKQKEKKKWLEYGAVCFAILLQYALVVFNAYVVDFQPQGRYMLPALFYVAYLVHICEDVKKSRILRLLLCATCILSLYAFWEVGVPNLVPLNTVFIN